jgi:hypothetical protein
LIAVLLFMTTPATLTRIFHDLGYLVFRTFGCCRGEGCHVLTGDTSCFGALVRDLLV